jgi:hypothetical protein
MNNNPVVFVDPTGHMVDQGGGASSMGNKWWEDRQKRLDFLNKKEKDNKPSFIPLNTATPTGPTYNPAPSATPDTILDHNGNTESDWSFPYNVSMDMNKVDKLELVIDVVGIVGEPAAVFSGVPWGISEVAEGAGFVKDVYDMLVKYDTTGLSKDLVINALEAIPDAERLAPPGIGFWGKHCKYYPQCRTSSFYNSAVAIGFC